MKNEKYFKLLLLSFLLLITAVAFGQIGTSPADPYVIYPSTSCGNNCGAQLCGNMQCPTGDCGGAVSGSGSSAGFDPACSTDDERLYNNVIWLRVHATASTFTINNGSPYVGSGAANANKRDYAVYSGIPGSLVQLTCGSVAANSSAVVNGLTAGVKYYVMISPPAAYQTAVVSSICITAPVAYAAAGNTCATALPLTTNVTYTMTNAGATPNGPICSGSIENEVWYNWCAPANWPAGQTAYVSVYNQICNTTQGLQLSVWNTGSTCPTAATNATVVCQNPGVTTPYYYQWTPVANQCYLIAIDGYAGTACEFRLTVGSIIVLPIELLSFDVNDRDGNAQIKWVTATETNNSHFTVERSSNGTEYEAIAYVPGSGTSTEIHSYSTIDQHPLEGLSYYRLKQTDFDGKFTYSAAVTYRKKGELKDVQILPNPAEDYFKVILSDRISAARVTLHDLHGKVVAEKQFEAGDTQASLDVSTLSKGVYFVKVFDNSSVTTEQLVLR